MTPEDITHYSDDELSLRVFNEEPLYRAARRAASAASMGGLLAEMYTFTDAQWKEFVADWEADQQEP